MSDYVLISVYTSSKLWWSAWNQKRRNCVKKEKETVRRTRRKLWEERERNCKEKEKETVWRKRKKLWEEWKGKVRRMRRKRRKLWEEREGKHSQGHVHGCFVTDVMLFCGCVQIKRAAIMSICRWSALPRITSILFVVLSTKTLVSIQLGAYTDLRLPSKFLILWHLIFTDPEKILLPKSSPGLFVMSHCAALVAEFQVCSIGWETVFCKSDGWGFEL